MATSPACLVLVLCLAAFVPSAASQTSDDKAWTDFLQWLETAPQANGPFQLLGGYRAAVQARGLPQAESERQLTAVLRLMRERTDAWPLMFDNMRFEDADGISEWDPQPTSLVRMIAQKRP